MSSYIWSHSYISFFWEFWNLEALMQKRKNKTSDSQKKAVKKYLSKFVDVKIRVTAEDREQIQSHAIMMGESMASFIKRAISETMERDQSSSDSTN